MRVVIAHGHIFKNAGSTFDWSLQRCFGDAFLDHRDDTPMRERGAEHLREVLEDNPGIGAISSHHMCNPLPQMEGVQFEPAFFLRHPIERIVSVYEFERRQESDSPGAQAAKRLNFTQYVEWRMERRVARTIRDYQTGNICGMHDKRPVGADGVDCQVGPIAELQRDRCIGVGGLQLAIERLQASACVGVVDRYDESVVIFEQHLKQFFPDIDLSYLRQNYRRRLLSRGNSLQDEVENALQKLGKLRMRVLDNNSYDLALYRLANQKLNTAIENTDDFNGLLADFRARCKALKKR